MTVKKSIKFNYFEIALKMDEIVIATNDSILQKIEKIKGKKGHKNDELLSNEEDLIIMQEVYKGYQASKWDISEMLNYYIKKPKKGTCLTVDGTKFEIEPDSLKYDKKDNIYSFQITKFRDTNIPAKKKIGEIKEDIFLTDEEYIGEFVSILYDNKNYSVMLQSNNYGASIKQVEKYLTLLRRKYIKAIKDKESIEELVCELRVITDSKEIIELKEAEYFKNIRLRGSDVMIDSLLNEKDLMSKVKRKLGNQYGVEIDIKISVNTTKRTDSLNQDNIVNIIDTFTEMLGSNDNKKSIIDKFEISKKIDDDTNVELIDLITPRMKSIIIFNIEERKSIDHVFMKKKMVTEYKKKRGIIEKILSPTT